MTEIKKLGGSLPYHTPDMAIKSITHSFCIAASTNYALRDMDPNDIYDEDF